MPTLRKANGLITRGWTQQELVAPESLAFYDDDWTVIGNRGAERIRGILQRTTGINLDFLHGPTQERLNPCRI